MKILSRNQEKTIRSLRQKKNRKEHRLFVVEGKKMVLEALKSSFIMHTLVATQAVAKEMSLENKAFIVTDDTLKQLSSLTTPPGVLAVMEQTLYKESTSADIILALDRIKDPGNLGTIIRTCDALGVKEIICSEDTVDCYSPKVVQATMGSIFRVKLKYLDLTKYIADLDSNKELYAAHLDGINIYKQNIRKPCILLMGNESEGISERLMTMVNNKIKVPIDSAAESLNVSIATAIILSELKRQFTNS